CERQSIEPVDGGQIDGDWQLLAVDFGQDAMLVGTPFRELGQVIEDHIAVRVEDMRSILVNEDPGIVVPIIGVAADMRAAVDKQHLFLTLTGKTLGNNASREARTDN